MTLSAVEILFVLLLFLSVQLLVFIKIKKARILLLNIIPPLLMLAPMLPGLKNLPVFNINFFLYAGLFSYPLAFTTLVMDDFPLEKKQHIFKSILLLLPFIFLFIIFRKYSIIMTGHISIYVFLFFSIDESLEKKMHIPFIMIFPSMIILAHSIFHQPEEPPSEFIALICIISFFFVFYEYSRKLHFANLRLSSINALNKRLNQIITRLRQSNNSLKKIISQKDVELLQIARHASLAEVTTGIAHELAQPLTGIKCISQNMIDDINYNELDHMQAVSDLVKISALVDRSSSIIDHIRTFSRKRGFTFQEADLNACILNAIELISNQMSNSGIDLIFMLDDSVPRIYGDNLSLEQLFINLILNSKDAILTKITSAGDFNGIIKITTAYNEGVVKLVIEDNGSGIPQDIIPKIWTPFFTTKQKGKGTGIGLSLSHRIIKEHNADVSINSSGEGTVFTIVFPVEHPNPEELSQS